MSKINIIAMKIYSNHKILIFRMDNYLISCNTLLYFSGLENIFTLYQNKFGLFRFISLPSNLSNTVKLNKSEITRTITTQVFLKTTILARGQKESPLPEVKLLSFTGHNSPSRRKVMTFNPKA